MKLNIEELAREAGAVKERDETFGPTYEFELSQLEAFARLIFERCAQECDRVQLHHAQMAIAADDEDEADFREAQACGAEDCSESIRNLLED